jgi:hypothetical protein
MTVVYFSLSIQMYKSILIKIILCFKLTFNFVSKAAGNTDKRLVKIAQKIKKMRLDKGYTSYETFAWEHEMNRVQYWRIEKGSNITLASLLKVLDIHKITLDEFFSDIK